MLTRYQTLMKISKSCPVFLSGLSNVLSAFGTSTHNFLFALCCDKVFALELTYYSIHNFSYFFLPKFQWSRIKTPFQNDSKSLINSMSNLVFTPFKAYTGRQKCCFVVPFSCFKAIKTVQLWAGVRGQNEHLVAGVAGDNNAKPRERYQCPFWHYNDLISCIVWWSKQKN